jgi:hypothetical protein
VPAALPPDAIVGTAGSGKTYAAKGFVERLLDSGARVAIVDPLGVWWGLRANADGSAAGFPVVVFGGRHADVPITAEMDAALGRMIAREALVCVVDLSELGSNAARRRFMASRCSSRKSASSTLVWPRSRRLLQVPGRRGMPKSWRPHSARSRAAVIGIPGSPYCATMVSLRPMAGATGAPRSFGSNEDLRLRAILSDLIRSCRIYGALKRLGQGRPSRDE